MKQVTPAATATATILLDQAPANEIYLCPIFKWVARIIVSELAARVTFPTATGYCKRDTTPQIMIASFALIHQFDMEILWTVRCRYNAANFLQNPYKNTSHSSPVRATYGMNFLGSNSNLYSISVTAVTYSISCHIGTHYNGTPLYYKIMALHILRYITRILPTPLSALQSQRSSSANLLGRNKALSQVPTRIPVQRRWNPWIWIILK